MNNKELTITILGVIAFFAVTIGATVLFSCKQGEPAWIEKDSYEIIDFNPPKHVHVKLKRQDGRVFDRVTVGKHFNEWREKLIVGRMVTLTRAFYADGSSKFINVAEDLRKD